MGSGGQGSFWCALGRAALSDLVFVAPLFFGQPMSISVSCPSCRKALKAPDKAAGRKVKCPGCGTTLVIPEPQAAKAAFEDLPQLIPTVPRPKARTWNRAVLLAAAGGGILALLVLAVVVVLAFNSGRSKSPVEAKDRVAEGGDELLKKTKPQAADGNAGGAEKHKKTPIVQDRKDTVPDEAQREEQKKKEIERAIQDAESLQAPAIVKGQINNALPFAQQMWDLATNEFKLQAAKGKVYRSRFNQKDQAAVLKWFFARNSFVGPGKYDFKIGEFILDPVLWQEYYGESEALGKFRPETTDSCVLLMHLKVDAATAEQWRTKMEKKTFALTVWYRFREVKRATRKENPHWTDGRLAYDIAFIADVLKFEESADETPDEPRPKKEEQTPAPKQTASARSTADDYMKSLEKKGLIRLPVYAGMFKNPKGKDSYAVAYKVSSANGKKVLGDTVHLFVFKDKTATWQVSAFSQDGVHVMLGPPPREFQRVSDPVEKK